ncbi:hypothetical protein [Sediminitomix flava]|uniref:Lipocalin-like protein n=1 Tax=Sediminitomix flava TaxID=379075 RepID=A0A315ZAF3_SEDFL|nr:hypothetical protein [Sediminitomix flava]PWJ41818.1 hypothetical protein BC781_10368 [Sediminitomix flava]
MTKFPKVLLIVCLALLTLSFISIDHVENNRVEKVKGILTSQKWTVVEVKRNKLTKENKMDGFRIEVGNVLSFNIDGKFGFKNNDYKYQAGKWVVNNKELVLVHDALTTESRIESTTYKIVKAKKGQLLLKRLTSPKGKIVLK